jgi:hypothetical protein
MCIVLFFMMQLTQSLLIVVCNAQQLMFVVFVNEMSNCSDPTVNKCTVFLGRLHHVPCCFMHSFFSVANITTDVFIP